MQQEYYIKFQILVGLFYPTYHIHLTFQQRIITFLLIAAKFFYGENFL